MSGARNTKCPRHQPGAAITSYRDGPYLVRGDFELIGEDGVVIETRRATIALCRCGRSRIGPFCDGTHKVIGFQELIARV